MHSPSQTSLRPSGVQSVLWNGQEGRDVQASGQKGVEGFAMWAGQERSDTTAVRPWPRVKGRGGGGGS